MGQPHKLGAGPGLGYMYMTGLDWVGATLHVCFGTSRQLQNGLCWSLHHLSTHHPGLAQKSAPIAEATEAHHSPLKGTQRLGKESGSDSREAGAASTWHFLQWHGPHAPPRSGDLVWPGLLHL